MLPEMDTTGMLVVEVTGSESPAIVDEPEVAA
jgi:hypothetical protein